MIKMTMIMMSMRNRMLMTKLPHKKTFNYYDITVITYDNKIETMIMLTFDKTSLGQAKGPPLSPEQAEIPIMQKHED